MLSTRRMRVAAGLAVSALVAVVAVSAGASANQQSAKLVIWADADRVPAVTQVANAWAASKGATVQVVQKDFGQIRSQLTTVAADTAPDVIAAGADVLVAGSAVFRGDPARYAEYISALRKRR